MFCFFPRFSVKSQESFANDIISNLCRFNSSNNNSKKKKKNHHHHHHNNDNKTLVKNLMLKEISHARVSDVFCRQYVDLIAVVLQCHRGKA